MVPTEGIGGVERAAASMYGVRAKEIDFSVKTIFPPGEAEKEIALWSPRIFILSIIDLWITAPDVLIVSLWRSCIVGIFIKLLRPSTRLVVFLHSTSDAHIFDCVLTRIAASIACRIWADSHETLKKRLPPRFVCNARVISFVIERVKPLPLRSIQPVFIFWGRLHQKKGLSRALRIFINVLEKEPRAKFLIIGPDAGDLSRISREIVEKGLNESVQILGPKSFSEIQLISEKASFYLQTSEMEGMALSVVEAMQLGLVPVVTPAGEIKHYARDGENSIWVMDDRKVVSDILTLLLDSASYSRCRENATQTWAEKSLYRDDVIGACAEFLRLKHE